MDAEITRSCSNTPNSKSGMNMSVLQIAVRQWFERLVQKVREPQEPETRRREHVL